MPVAFLPELLSPNHYIHISDYLPDASMRAAMAAKHAVLVSLGE